MTNTDDERNAGIARRTIFRRAAWSVPVVAAAIATPLAAASEEVLETAQVTRSTTSVLVLDLDSPGSLTAAATVTVPTALTIRSGSRAIDAENVLIAVTVGRPFGVDLPVGKARGFGVQSFHGVATTAGERSLSYQNDPLLGDHGFPVTTWTGMRSLTIPRNGAVSVPVEFGLTGDSTGASVTALCAFPVTITLTFADTHTATAPSSVLVQAGAGIL